jgi:transketolase
MTGNFEDPRKVFGAAVSAIALEREEIVLLSADSGKSSGFQPFLQAAPERYFEFGIMEQAVVGIAAGLAAAGKIPVFCAIAPFTTARPYEMLRNDLGYMGQNVKIVGRNGGISYSDLGATHHSLDDFALMRAIPGMTVLCPQDPNEIRAAAAAMLDHKGPVYMRIGNDKIPNLLEEAPFVIGKGRKIFSGTDVTILSTGSLTAAAMEAAQALQKEGYAPELIGLPTVWPLDEEAILASVRKTGKVVTVEEHYRDGGLGSAVADLLCTAGCPAPVRKLAIPMEYATSGPYQEVLSYYDLNIAGVSKAAITLIRNT